MDQSRLEGDGNARRGTAMSQCRNEALTHRTMQRFAARKRRDGKSEPPHSSRKTGVVGGDVDKSSVIKKMGEESREEGKESGRVMM